MDKAATSHNTDLDETHEDLLNHLFLQWWWSTPVLCSA